MTKLEAHIILLEQAIQDSQNTISFLHGCLTNPQYKYSYPDQTIKTLNKLEKLVPPHQGCFHSGPTVGCDSCREREVRFAKRQEALEVLGLTIDEFLGTTNNKE